MDENTVPQSSTDVSTPFVPPPSTGPTENDRLMAGLAYLLWFVGAAIILVSKDMKDRPLLRYHAIQGLGLSAVLTVVTFFLVVAGILVCCFWVMLLIPIGVTLYYAYQGYQGLYFKIPILTNVMIMEGWLKQA